MSQYTIAKFMIIFMYFLSLIIAQEANTSSVENITITSVGNTTIISVENANTSTQANITITSVDNATTTSVDNATTISPPTEDANKTLTLDEEVFKNFHDFVRQYNVTYLSMEQMEERFKIFKINYIKIKDLNALNSTEYTLGVNKFFDLTEEEFAEMYLSKDMDTTDIEEAQKPTQESLIMTMGSIEDLNENLNEDQPIGNPDEVATNSTTGAGRRLQALPYSWDWRSRGCVSRVKNQGSCGACWAFGLIGNLEGRYCLKYRRLETFSEQSLLSCDAFIRNGCNGGLLTNALASLKLGRSALVREYQYPYVGYRGICNYFGKTVIDRVIGYQFAGTTNEDAIAQMLLKYGPLTIQINARKLIYYRGGIFDINNYYCDPWALNHAVTLVGYGVEYGRPYWTVKNSWGATWGENGYFRIARGKGTCGLNQYVLTGHVA